VLTGDRSALTEATTQAMRDTNIAHILSISGLHMVLLTGFVYSAARLILSLIPPLALRYPIRKWAAVLALAAGAFYLALSGGGVPTERAFIQVAVMFAAVLLDRRAITLRSVAIAGVIVLLWRPETLFSPGFQMSFAATAALVGAFAALREATWLKPWPGWAKGVFSLVASSVVAGAATAPFAAAHFNQMSTYGLIANLLTVPVMGSLIMPAAVVAAILWPLGLSAPVWVVMGWGLNWTLRVAEVIADWPGAVRLIGDPPGWALAAVSLGGLIVLLWQGRARWLGVVPCAVALALWGSEARPVLLVSDSGGLVGLMTDQGRALSRERGNGFVAEIWLENDGDGATQAEAAARQGWRDAGEGRLAEFGGWTIWHGTGRGGLAAANAACATHDVVVLSEPLRDGQLAAASVALAATLAGPDAVAVPRGEACVVIDAGLLATTGALSLAPEGPAIVVTTARMVQGDRPWSP
jgi:competence protein ComEC